MMEENKETGNDKQDVTDNDQTNAQLVGEGSLLPSLVEEQNPSDNVGLQIEGLDGNEEQNPSENVGLQTEGPGDKEEQTSSENVELQKECPDDFKEQDPSKDAELLTECPFDNKEETINKDMDLQTEGQDVDKEENRSEDVGLQLEDPNVIKEQNPSENMELPTGDLGLVETVVSETAAADVDTKANGVHGSSEADGSNVHPPDQLESRMSREKSLDRKAEDDDKRDVDSGMELCSDREIKEEVSKPELDENKELPKPELDVVKEEVSKTVLDVGHVVDMKSSNQLFLSQQYVEGDESGSEEEQVAFMREVENFFKEKNLEFKAPKFYGEGLNLLKLWRAVTRLGGYDQVTSCKLWRQVGESFKPPKTCTTVSWTFRCFYEKALLEYEKHKMHGGELPLPDASVIEPTSIGNQSGGNQASGSGRARRDAAARAMQGWHSQRLLGNGEVGDPIIKDKSSSSTPKREKQLKSIGLLKRKRPSSVERAVKVARMKATKPHLETMVVDVGPPADWVKINVRKTKDCFEVYALVPGLLREEVRVQSDPVGRLVISGEPEQLDNPWGVIPFKKVVSLPSRIDPHQTSAVVTLHGQLFVRVPFEQSDL